MGIGVAREVADSFAARGGEAHLERMLDAALEATFPASDPVAITAAANYACNGSATTD